MKLISIAIFLMFAACTTPKALPITEHEKTIQKVKVVYNSNGEWIKLTASGTAPLHNQSIAALSEAGKIAAMRARQNISQFLSNSVESTQTADISSRSNTLGASSAVQAEGDQTTYTIAVEHLKESSSSILKGVQVTDSKTYNDMVVVEVSVDAQSIVAAKSIAESLK